MSTDNPTIVPTDPKDVPPGNNSAPSDTNGALDNTTLEEKKDEPLGTGTLGTGSLVAPHPLPTADTAYAALLDLSFGKHIAVMQHAPPAAHTMEYKVLPRFLFYDGNLIVNRPKTGHFGIFVYFHDGKHSVSPEDGWHGRREEEDFYQFLGNEKIYESSSAEEKEALGANISDEDKERDDLFKFLVGTPPSDTLLTRHQGEAPIPRIMHNPEVHRSTFFVKLRKIHAQGYLGNPVKSPLEIITHRGGPPRPLVRWRTSGPSPIEGWESDKEAQEFLYWARYEKAKIEATLAGRPIPTHPLDIPPRPKPFDFVKKGYKFVKEGGAEAYLRTREIPRPELRIGWDTSDPANLANVVDVAYLNWAIMELHNLSDETIKELRATVEQQGEYIKKLDNNFLILRRKFDRIIDQQQQERPQQSQQQQPLQYPGYPQYQEQLGYPQLHNPQHQEQQGYLQQHNPRYQGQENDYIGDLSVDNVTEHTQHDRSPSRDRRNFGSPNRSRHQSRGRQPERSSPRYHQDRSPSVRRQKHYSPRSASRAPPNRGQDHQSESEGSVYKERIPRPPSNLNHPRPLPILPARRRDQHDWPQELWTYRFGRFYRKEKPKLTSDPAYACDVPRKCHNQDQYLPPNPRIDLWYNDEVPLDYILEQEDYDPEFRGIEDIAKVREKYLKYAAPGNWHPLGFKKNHPEEYDEMIYGNNKGYRCGACMGFHYIGYCLVHPLNSDLRKIIEKRAGCVICRRYNHEAKDCDDRNPRLCEKGCPLPRHHKEICSRQSDDQQRQRLHGRT